MTALKEGMSPGLVEKKSAVSSLHSGSVALTDLRASPFMSIPTLRGSGSPCF